MFDGAKEDYGAVELAPAADQGQRRIRAGRFGIAYSVLDEDRVHHFKEFGGRLERSETESANGSDISETADEILLRSRAHE